MVEEVQRNAEEAPGLVFQVHVDHTDLGRTVGQSIVPCREPRMVFEDVIEQNVDAVDRPVLKCPQRES